MHFFSRWPKLLHSQHCGFPLRQQSAISWLLFLQILQASFWFILLDDFSLSSSSLSFLDIFLNFTASAISTTSSLICRVFHYTWDSKDPISYSTVIFDIFFVCSIYYKSNDVIIFMCLLNKIFFTIFWSENVLHMISFDSLFLLLLKKKIFHWFFFFHFKVFTISL